MVMSFLESLLDAGTEHIKPRQSHRTEGVARAPAPSPAVSDDYGTRAGWYDASSFAGDDEAQARRMWIEHAQNPEKHPELRAFNGDFERYMAFQRRGSGRRAAGLEDQEVFNKARELRELSRRGVGGGMSEWERKLRDSFQDSSNRLYSRAQMAGRNRAAVSRAFTSSMKEKERDFEGSIRALREEESKIAGDALASLLRTARTAGAQEAVAEAQMLQQWQQTKENETLDMVANIVSGAAALGAGLILL